MPRIMVVDDSKFSRAHITEQMREAGFEVFCEAASGEEAIDNVKQVPIDFITMDVEMGGVSGIEAAKEIKKISPDTKIAIVTSVAETLLDTDGSARTAIDSILTKPVSVKDLKNFINGEKN